MIALQEPPRKQIRRSVNQDGWVRNRVGENGKRPNTSQINLERNENLKNTHTEYLSSERTPTVYPEMEELLPVLSAEEFSALEADILVNGCYAPITVNQDLVVVDGHNRYRICQEHDLPFRMQVFQFDDLLEAKQWAFQT